MNIQDIKDHSQDDTASTKNEYSIVTEQNCIVEGRLFTYLDDNAEIQLEETITMQVPSMALEDQVYRSLEDLRAETEGDMVVDMEEEDE